MDVQRNPHTFHRDIDLGGNFMLDEQGLQDRIATSYYRFDGDGDYAELSDDAKQDVGINDFTLSVRFKPDDVSTARQVLQQKESGGIGYGLEIREDDLWIRFDDNTTDVTAKIATAVISNDVWFHYLVRFDRSGNATAYINGIKVGTVAISTASLTLSNAGAYRVGTESGGTTLEFTGQISHNRIFNYLISENDAKSYSQGGAIDYSDIGPTNLELMPNQVDRDFSGASAWTNVDIDAYDESGDLTITATAADQYAQIAVASAPMTQGKRYRWYYDAANIVESWVIKDFTGVQTFGTISANATQGFIEFVVDSGITGGFRIVAGTTTSSIDFDNFSLFGAGAVSDYRPQSITAGTWFDLSGNDLDLTITNAIAVGVSETIITVEEIIFTGGTGDNKISIPDNLADALSIQEAANKYQTFVTTNGSESVDFLKQLNFTMPILTSGGTGDYGVKLTQILNDSGAAGGSDLYTGFLMDITETDVTGWDNVYLMDLQVGSTYKFRVDDSGNVNLAGSVFSFDGAVTIDTSGANLLTLTGAAAGVEIQDTLGVSRTPSVDSTISTDRTFTAGSSQIGRTLLLSDQITAAVGKDVYLQQIAGTITEAASGSHALFAGLFISAIPVTNAGAGTGDTASLYIQGAMTGITVTGAAYQIWADGTEVSRFDGNILSATTGGYLLVGSTAASGTVPVYAFDDDANTGLGSGGADQTSLIGGGEEILRVQNQGTGGNLTLIKGDSFTSGGTDDRAVLILATLNDSGAAGGSDLFNAVLVNIAQTDITGWDNVNLMSLQIGGNSIYQFDNLGTLTIGNDTANLSGKIAFVASDGDAADISINTSDQLLFANAGGGYLFDAAISLAAGIVTVSNVDINLIPNGTGNVNILGTSVSDNYDLALLGDGVLMMKEGTAPTADSGYGKIWTATDNEFHFQSGDGVVHTVLLGDVTVAFSNIWFHAQAAVAVSIGTADTFTLIDSFTVVGKQDTSGNATGSVSTNLITVGAGVGGDYTIDYHGSISNAGGGSKEMVIVPGITLATRLDITEVTDNTITPIVITITGHGFEDGDMVTIVDVLVNTAANGDWIVDNKTVNTFEIVALDGTASVGNGDYDEGTPTGEVSIFYPGNLITHSEISNTDLSPFAADGIDILLAGDKVGLYVANLDDTSNLSIAAISLDIHRIGDS